MKIFVLHLLRRFGFFALFRRLYRHKTLILAYHAVEIHDETEFRRQLFISQQTLAKRLDYLAKYCQVVSLERINNSSGRNRVVITLDDGWYSNLTLAAPLLAQYQFPYTVYLTDEDTPEGLPMFHVGLSYILTKNVGQRFVYNHPSGLSIDEVISREGVDPLIERIEPLKSGPDDMALLHQVAATLNFDFQPSIDNKAFTLISQEQAKQLHQQGANLQLHTHSHDTPLQNYSDFAARIEQNRQYINQITQPQDLQKPKQQNQPSPQHYCYPAGTFEAKTMEYLKQMGIASARTALPGFCDENTDPLALPSFLDSENIPQIVFEAEVCGLMSFLRSLVAKIKP